ncbi:MAG: hypothetical protein JNM10_19270 [Planctomycetia bacterium]|nr:hypothetical protein [Planctomycetia bacterium]
MRAPTLFIRLLRAGGVAVSAVLLLFIARGALGVWSEPERRIGGGAREALAAPVVAVLLALVAPWIARWCRWPGPSSPSRDTRAPESWSIALAVAGLVAAWMGVLAGVPLAHGGFPSVRDAAVICAASAAAAAFGFRPMDLRADLSRAEATVALWRVGALLGAAASLLEAGRFVETGRAIGWRYEPDDARWVLAPCLGLAAYAMLWWVAGRWCGDRPVSSESSLDGAACPDEPARLRHVASALAAVLAIALVGPIAKAAEGWRWRTELYARAAADAVSLEPSPPSDRRPPIQVPEWDGDIVPDGLPDPAGFARRAWTLTAGFAGFALVAAIAGRRRRGTRGPGVDDRRRPRPQGRW